MHDYCVTMNPENSIGVLYCDVMGLKKMNDSEGHRAGDELLIRSSECLKRVFKEYALFRVGGDEFLTLCEGIEEQELQERIGLLRQEMEECSAPMALGWVWHADNREQIDKLLTQADDKMYEDKRMLYATKFKELARD